MGAPWGFSSPLHTLELPLAHMMKFSLVGVWVRYYYPDISVYCASEVGQSNSLVSFHWATFPSWLSIAQRSWCFFIFLVGPWLAMGLWQAFGLHHF